MAQIHKDSVSHFGKQTTRERDCENHFAKNQRLRKSHNTNDRLELIRQSVERVQNKRHQALYGALVASKEEQ